MTLDDLDRRRLEVALDLAELGRGHVSPNPVVGAVVARGDAVLGTGWHEAWGAPHAEVNAIRASGAADLRGATLYVSLEPCCHHGRQPPCTEAIIAAGVRRVVVGAEDVNPVVAGAGVAALRAAGVEVLPATRELATRARLQNQPFRKHVTTRRPWVVLKSALSLDGRVATAAGDSRWISGERSRALVHRWRGELDAIAVGAGTVRADDPLLTARGANPPRQPRRVVFSARHGLDPASRLREDTTGGEVLVVGGEPAGGSPPERVVAALDRLGELDPPVTSLLLEGGPTLAGAFLDAGEIDEVRLFLAPLLIGGEHARGLLGGTGAERIADAVKPVAMTRERVGDDLLLTARLKEW